MHPENSEIGIKSAKHSVRRDYDRAYKIAVVKETLVPGASVSVVARRHDINSNVVFRWRKQYREGQLGDVSAVKALLPPDFVPVRVEEAGSASWHTASAKPEAGRGGVMELVLPGGFVLRAGADVDSRALRRVLRVVRNLS